MKQAKIEIIQKTDKTYTYKDKENKEIKYILYNIKLSIFRDMVNYSYPIEKQLSFEINDTVEFLYDESKNKISKVQKIKQAMYSNFTKEEKPEYKTRLDTGRSILLQVAFKEASAAYLAGKITQDEVESLTNKYYNIINK
jgi:hypothetical protein